MPRTSAFKSWLIGVIASIVLVVVSSGTATAAQGIIYVLRQVDSGPNQVYAFHIDPVTGSLSAIAGYPRGIGANGGVLSASEQMAFSHGRLYIVNDGSDTLSVYDVNELTGALSPPFSPISLGIGAWSCVSVSPTGSPVVVGDGNNSKFLSFAVALSTATPAPGNPYSAGGSAAPFSCAFSRDRNYVYTGGNLGGAIAGFSVSPGTPGNGALDPLDLSPFNSGGGNPIGYATDYSGRLFSANLSDNSVRAFTTPGGVPTGVTGNPFSAGGLIQAAAGVLHPGGFYMVADRAGRVGVYRIGGSGSSTTLTGVTGSPFITSGTFTDALALAYGGAFLVAANGFSRNLTVFRVDPVSGTLSPVSTQPANTLGTAGTLTGIAYAPGPAPFDFDGDVHADPVVYRPATGEWWINNSRSDYSTAGLATWGLSTDVPLSGDYDGDGRADIVAFRPSTGTWYILKSSTNFTLGVSYVWGLGTDTLVPADYDGDGKTDVAIYRPSAGTWYILRSSTGYTDSVSYAWGVSTDTTVPGDYDGDGKADVAIYRPSTGIWYILQSSTGYSAYVSYTWGVSTDTTVAADYDGDGKADVAVYRPSSGTWYILQSSTGYTAYVSYAWGLSTDTAVPADYDGDGRADVAVYRPSTGTWYVLQSSTNSTTSASYAWGLSTDVPISRRP